MIKMLQIMNQIEKKKKKNLFSFRIIGDALKKSQKLGVYNNRYL